MNESAFTPLEKRWPLRTVTGFTLIELLTVVIIIGILATMAVPQYQKVVNRARWAECMQLSGSVKLAEHLFRAEHGGAFTPEGAVLVDLDPYLDLPPLLTRRFVFSIKRATMVYGVYRSSDRYQYDDFTVDDLRYPYFALDLDNNTLSYGGTDPGPAPGNL